MREKKMEQKRKKRYVQVGMCLLILVVEVIFFIQASVYDQPVLRSIRASCELSENWVMTIEGTQERKIVDLPYVTKENIAENRIMIERNLPETNFSDAYLRLGSSQQEIRVYVDG